MACGDGVGSIGGAVSPEHGACLVQDLSADIAALKRQVIEAHERARSAVRTYNRASWLRFAATFIPVPLIVVTGRLYFAAWHYYVLGGAFFAVALAMYALDTRAAEKRDRALKAARDARIAYRRARAAR